MGNNDHQHTRIESAESVCKACIEAARDGFKDASMSGLCTEGPWKRLSAQIKSSNWKV